MFVVYIRPVYMLHIFKFLLQILSKKKRIFLFNRLVVILIFFKNIYSQTVRIIKHVSRNSTTVA